MAIAIFPTFKDVTMADDRKVPQPETEPGVASAEERPVILDGPDGTAVTMTPSAAVGTGESLLFAAANAERQTTEK
jgi:hypothetical protein